MSGRSDGKLAPGTQVQTHVLHRAIDDCVVISPDFESWLLVRTQEATSKFKRYWCVLVGQELDVYKDESTKKKVHEIALSHNAVITSQDFDGYPNGFSIQPTDNNEAGVVYSFRAMNMDEKRSWLHRLAHSNQILQWLEEYTRQKLIGRGASGNVYELEHKETHEKVALKECVLASKSDMERAIKEANLLRDIAEEVNHPYILRIKKVFEIGNKFYMVFPLCTGGELFKVWLRSIRTIYILLLFAQSIWITQCVNLQ